MQRIFFLPLILISLFVSVSVVSAQDSLIPVKNNRFGIHILDESDLPDAASLVNSSGGSWGYVTFVIREDEMDIGRWTNAFNQMKDLKLIPIVRIATIQRNGVWEKPNYDNAEKWATFLGSLPWPTTARYVVLFNEPNHAKEWGGKIEPDEYAKMTRRYWEELKKNSFDFFVLPAGMDAAASNGNETENSKNFFDDMAAFDPLIFTLFDGWTSHSYPNPDFSGSPSENGKMSIRGFEWEVNYLSKYHLPTNSPVFITETGWKNNGRDQEQIAQNYKQAFSEAWNNPNVVAVTPFLLRYDAKPFSAFSWKIPGTNTYYPYYSQVLGISKVAGEPK